MKMTDFQVKMNLCIAVLTVVALIYFVGRSKLKASGELEKRKKRKLHNRFVFYNSNFLTRNRFRRIVMQYSSLACYDMDKVREESVKLFEKALAIALLLPVCGLVLFQNILLTLLVAFVGYIYYDISVEKQIDKMYEAIIKELSVCIQSTREKYLETNDIPMSVLNCDKGKYLGKPLTQIYDMLVDTDSEEKLYQLCRTSPVRLLKTFATVCYIVNDRGDIRGNNNSSAFADELTSLRQEADTEIRRLQKVRSAFKSLPALALVGIICTPIIDMFLMSQIAGIATLVKGLYGLIEKTLIIILTIASYYVISIYSRPTVVNVVDRVQWIDTLSKKYWVRAKVANLIPKSYKTKMKLKARIQGAVSSKSLEYIYVSKVIYSAALFVGTFLLLVLFTLTAKSWIWESHSSFSFVSTKTELTERATKRLYEVEEEYMTTLPLLTEEELTARLEARVPELSTMDVLNEAERIQTKYKKYNAIGYKWYYLVIAIVAGVGGWFVPEVSLMVRKHLVAFEETEDVMQLQTLMITLSETDMGIGDVLYWLQQQSTVHKFILTYALYGFDADPEGSLEELRESAGQADFKRLVSKLMSAVYALSLKEAFSDMALDKEHLLRVREKAQDDALTSKKENAKLFASAPIGLTLIFGFVGPIIILGFSEILKMFADLQG